MIAELETCPAEFDVLQQLRALPRDLNEAYDRVLKSLDNKYLAHTKMFLQWLAFSVRPMTIEEIAEIITIDFNSNDGPAPNQQKRYIDPKDVLLRCGSGLVSESNGKFYFFRILISIYADKSG